MKNAVAPLAGAWIEISPTLINAKSAAVAPLAGAWIEIRDCAVASICKAVAPLAGAWIEIPILLFKYGSQSSLPSRERGLKLSLLIN